MMEVYLKCSTRDDPAVLEFLHGCEKEKREEEPQETKTATQYEQAR